MNSPGLVANLRWDAYNQFTITSSSLADTRCDGKSMSWRIYISTYVDRHIWWGNDRANGGGCGSTTTWGSFSGTDTRGCGIWAITVHVYAAGSDVASRTYYNPYSGPRC